MKYSIILALILVQNVTLSQNINIQIKNNSFERSTLLKIEKFNNELQIVRFNRDSTYIEFCSTNGNRKWNCFKIPALIENAEISPNYIIRNDSQIYFKYLNNSSLKWMIQYHFGHNITQYDLQKLRLTDSSVLLLLDNQFLFFPNNHDSLIFCNVVNGDVIPVKKTEQYTMLKSCILQSEWNSILLTKNYNIARIEKYYIDSFMPIPIMESPLVMDDTFAISGTDQTAECKEFYRFTFLNKTQKHLEIFEFSKKTGYWTNNHIVLPQSKGNVVYVRNDNGDLIFLHRSKTIWGTKTEMYSITCNSSNYFTYKLSLSRRAIINSDLLYLMGNELYYFTVKSSGELKLKRMVLHRRNGE